MSWGKNIKGAFQVVKALPVRSLLLALPVAAATALGLTTLAVDRGVSAKAREAVESWGLDQVVIHGSGVQIAGQAQGELSLTQRDLEELKSQLAGSKVKYVLPTKRNNKTPVSFGGKSAVYKVFGVTPHWDDARHFHVERGKGEFLDENDLEGNASVCLIGQTVIRELFDGQNPMGQEILLNDVPFKVKGILETKGSSPAEGDRDARVMIPITTFYSKLQKKEKYDQIVIQASNYDEETIKWVADKARAVLRKQHNLTGETPDDFTVRLPETVTEEARTISRSVFWLLLGLAGVCVLVAAAVIGLVFHQTVSDRRGEIGIRRALGAEPGDILQQIWVEGLLISMFGGILGLIVGLAAAWALNRWGGWPFVLDVPVLVVPLVVAVVTSLVGLVPARSAASLDPAQALRPAA